MFRSYKKAAIAVGAIVAGLGVSQSAFAGAVTLIQADSSAVVDGWDISTPNSVSLTVTTNGGQIDIEKVANFTAPGQSLQIGFNPVSGVTGATTIDITNETIFNNTGTSIGGFDFLLNNVGSANATFGGDVFVNAIGSTPGSLDASKDLLAYVGSQASGATAHWGGSSATDDLLIDAPAGSVFVFDEASVPGGGNAVPLPAAAWQSLFGLAGLGVFGLARRQIKRRSLAL